MTKYSILFTTLLVLCLACMAPQKEPPVFSRELARIDDMIIKEDVLRFRLHLEMSQYPEGYYKRGSGGVTQGPRLKELVSVVLGEIINDYAMITYGKKKNIVIDENIIAAKLEKRQKEWNPKSFDHFLNENNIPYSRWKQLVEDEIRVQQIMEKELSEGLAVSLAEVTAYYQKNSQEFEVGERVKVRQIVTDSLEKANELHERLLGGENFAKLAINHSLSPDRANGGDLGYFARGSYPKEFDETCFKLEKGQISPVVKSDYGYHIFKLLHKKPAGKKSLDEVASQIHQILFEEKLKTKYDAWLKKVKNEVKITVHREVLDNLTL
ncbi:MAG: peptidylprolyl isomerase [Deltaproteobacteria bacterium]|nr:peptidylprolyl isomerase [Deltaproteobacteria bacterium]